MKAVVFDRYGDASVLAVRDIPAPATDASQVQVRVRAAALNPKDLLVRKGKFKLFTGSRFPLGVGYDFSGEVIGGSKFEKGTTVYGMLNGWFGRTLAEEVVCPANECAAMPELTFTEAAAIPLAALTALQALRDLGRLQPGQTVCINGASGGVGVYAVQIAKALGAQVTTLSSARNLELCRSLGADETLDYAQDKPFNRSNGFDVFFDVFGNLSLAKIRNSLKPHGTYVDTVPSRQIIWDSLRTSLGWSKRARLVVVRSRSTDLDLLSQWVTEGKLRPVVDQIFRLDQTAEAEKYLETKRARGKVVIEIN
ncbi:MAG: NAD(P)-dependent alcohol dehydrogenase [Blastocatellia bacterium]|nr:NAD(P)-dependent alcohol dehydrogenase [Blastocatellia bacterium]